ncbi:MAG: HIG1 domain-containing protein [Gammaproteobacteria bacterium]|nr:HIG1 domain-containing protein [Gammaproteobacteria bacterium]
MSLLVAVVITALVATIVSLSAGIISMGSGGEFDQQHATHLMYARVGCQGLAVIAMLAALWLTAAGGG